MKCSMEISSDNSKASVPKKGIDVFSGVSYKTITDIMGNYQADRIFNETSMGTEKLKYFETFVTEEILPRITEKDERFYFNDVIPTGSFREHSVICRKTNFQNYIEHEFDFMLALKGVAGADGLIVVDCNSDDVNATAYKHICLSGNCLKIWKDCCMYIDDRYFLMADKIMQAFEKAVFEVIREMMEREEGFSAGCIDVTTNGPAITLEFDIAKLPSEMQNPYPEDWRSVNLRKVGGNVINNWSIDLVLCLECTDLLFPYTDWLSRPRIWPSKDLEDQILGLPIIFVPKANEMIKASWRISTSTAELMLADDICKHQPLVRNCWLILKAILKCHLYQPKCITSYNLKTLIFYILEHTPINYWTDDNLPELILAVMDAFIVATGKRFFPHYFCPSVNLLYREVSNEELMTLLKICLDIRSKPDVYLMSTPNFEAYLTDLL